VTDNRNGLPMQNFRSDAAQIIWYGQPAIPISATGRAVCSCLRCADPKNGVFRCARPFQTTHERSAASYWRGEDHPRPTQGKSRVLAEAARANRFTLEHNRAGGSRLPESDRKDREVFLARIYSRKAGLNWP
jgi:hypothetical protein